MEDARTKLEKDLFFPPGNPETQPFYTYSEDLTDIDNTTSVRSYTVTVDITRKRDPFALVRLASVGAYGQRDHPLGRYRIYSAAHILAGQPRGPQPEPVSLSHLAGGRRGDCTGGADPLP